MFKKTNIRVICFDFDGTIAATMPFLTELAVDVLTKHCHLAPEYARDQYIQTTGLPFEEQVERICGGDVAAAGAAISEFEHRKESEYFRMAPETHAVETLDELKARGYIIAISSSTHEELVRQYLSHYGLSPNLVMGLRPNFRKGQDHFAHLRQKYQIEYNAICFVADSINDYFIATRFGVGFIAKSGVFDQAAFRAIDANVAIIADLKELLAIFNYRHHPNQ